jgi:hypothetical protein
MNAVGLLFGSEKPGKKKKQIDRTPDEFYFQNMTRAFVFSYQKVGSVNTCWLSTSIHR